MGAGTIAINVTALTVVLLFRANRFDADELKNIGTFAGVISGIGGVVLSAYKGLADRKSGRGDETES